MQFSPLSHTQLLYRKYSSSQTYFYSNKINQIIKEKRTSVNIFYEDIEYILDYEQNLKRWYQGKQYNNKMFTFKEYYFYHHDCPRIFMKGVEEAYNKWQDRKRDLIYKKLKLLYNESFSSQLNSREEQPSNNHVGVTHFLLDISDYNPYSKKYYLRVEAKREKEKLKEEQKNKKNNSKKDISNLKHDLSQMLNDLSLLSDISTLSNNNTPTPFEKYKSTKLNTISKKSLEKSNSTNLSNSNSIIKFNFKKSKDSAEKNINKEIKKSEFVRSKSKDLQKIQLMPDNQKMSPKFNPQQTQLLKSKSIFSVSSFGPLYKTNEVPLISKREPLKLNIESKKLTLPSKRYESQKKKQLPSKNIIIKTKSTYKLEPHRSIQKLKREGTEGRLKKKDEFSDKRMSEVHPQLQTRTRSFKSQFAPNIKKSLFQVKPTLQIDRGRRILQLKH